MATWLQDLADVASFLDPFWDYGTPAEVERDALARLTRQLSIAHETEAFRARIPQAWTARRDPLTRAELNELPVVTKQELRALRSDDLLTDADQVFHLVRGTGGTTGKPVSMFWTEADWRALVHAMQRFAAPLKRLGVRRIWNGYNQAHVSGPAFDDLVRALGATPVPRHFRTTDAEALDEIAELGADALIITPRAGSGKGGSLEDLLAVDPSFLARLKIRALIVSSTPLDRDVLEEVREQGVVSVINYYGSTESPPAAVSCELDATSFHLTNGHVLVEVLGSDGRQVRAGERGAVVVSRIGAEGTQGLLPAAGTQLIRYAIGDTAVYCDEPCACGRSSARLVDVQRMPDLADTLKGGCERWE